MRMLIVNADDFGRSAGVNQGIIEAHEHGIVTSTSMMVRWPAAVAAAEYARQCSELSVGLHLDLAEWELQDGEWVCRYQVVPNEEARVRIEVEKQLERFRELLGRDPTHLDSHQHAHRNGPARSTILELGTRLGVPVRHFTPGLMYCGKFYGQSRDGSSFPNMISVEGLLGLLRALPEGVTELVCHPALASDVDSLYRDERSAEVRSLCHPSARATLAECEITLGSFSTFRSQLGVQSLGETTNHEARAQINIP